MPVGDSDDQEQSMSRCSLAEGITVIFSHERLLLGLDGRVLSDSSSWEVSRHLDEALKRVRESSTGPAAAGQTKVPSFNRHLIWQAASGISDETWSVFMQRPSPGSPELAKQLRTRLIQGDITQCPPATVHETAQIRGHPWSYHVFYPDGYPAQLAFNNSTASIRADGVGDGTNALSAVKMSRPKRSQHRSLKVDKITLTVWGQYGCNSANYPIVHKGFMSRDSARDLTRRLRDDPAVRHTLSWLRSQALDTQKAQTRLEDIISSQLQLTIAHEECPAVGFVRECYDLEVLDDDEAEEEVRRANEAHDRGSTCLDTPPQVGLGLASQSDENGMGDSSQMAQAGRGSQQLQRLALDVRVAVPASCQVSHNFSTHWPELPGAPKVSIVFTNDPELFRRR